MRPRLANPSPVVERDVGVPGVAEAAALCAAGNSAELVVPKLIHGRVTIAIARAAHPIEPSRLGRPQGRLSLVGCGPGDRAGMTGTALDALHAAEEIVGYGLYIDLLPAEYRTKTSHRFALGEETARCAFALDRAASGAQVALVCSGDAGIFAMASLVLELLDRERSPVRDRVAVEVVPGVSAMQAAAARAGAPLGHDFCAISLSDLMTPREVIERRLHAAAQADFVTALYNPVSQRRRVLLNRARDIYLNHRAPETPVWIARALGREGERCAVTTLAELSVDEIDMLSLVIIGSTSTKRLERLHGLPALYTPRGYGLEA